MTVAIAPRSGRMDHMKRGDGDHVADHGIVAEDISQLVEHIELTGAHHLPTDHDWELAPTSADLEDAPILFGEARADDRNPASSSAGEDLELFTETHADMTRLMPAAELPPPRTAFAVERARWQKRVDELHAALAERDRRIEQMAAMLTALAPDSAQGDGDDVAATESAAEGTMIMPRPELPPAVPAIPPAIPAVKPHAAPALRRYLIGLDVVGCVHEVSEQRISVGRTRDNDLRIVDSTVSRLHAMLSIRNGEALLVDANSRNGVFVNGIQVRYAKLADGDLVTFGTVRFRYRVASDGAGGVAGSA